MTPEEMKAEVAEHVKAATVELVKQVAELTKQVEALAKVSDKNFKAVGEELKKIKAAAPAPTGEVKKEPKKELKVPTKKIEVDGGLTVQFAKASFMLNKTLYISEAEVDNIELIKALVKNQTHKTRGFLDGVLKRVN